MNDRASGPWRHRDFRLIWAGGLVNDTGDWLLMVALPVYVLTETGSGIATALLFIAQLAPAALLGAFAGNLVDRWNLRLTVVATNVAQAVALLPLLAVTADRTWPVFLVTVAQGVLTRVNNPANAALLVRVVEDEELAAANTARAMAESLARLIGSPLGGIIVAVGGLPALVVVDGVSFLVVAAATAAVRSDARPLRRSAPAGDGAPGGTLAGLRVLRRARPVPALFATTTASQIAQGMFVVLFLAFVVQRLGGDGADVGIIRGMQAVGGIVGGLLLARVGDAPGAGDTDRARLRRDGPVGVRDVEPAGPDDGHPRLRRRHGARRSGRDRLHGGPDHRRAASDAARVPGPVRRHARDGRGDRAGDRGRHRRRVARPSPAGRAAEQPGDDLRGRRPLRMAGDPRPAVASKRS